MQYYNGAISAMSWHVPGESAIRKYNYLYDGMNRLSKATYSETMINASIPRDSLIVSTMSLIPSEHTNTDTQASNGTHNVPGIIINPLRPISTSNKYGEEIEYDKNSNITRLKRYGAKDDLTYGLIDDLEIAYNGNQRDSIVDNVDNLSYTGSSEFVEGSSGKYLYNINGALFSDLSRNIKAIEYDDLNNPRCIYFGPIGTTKTGYVYAADGTRLMETHTRPGGFGYLSQQGSISGDLSNYSMRDTTEYVGNLVIKNGHPMMLHFDGGYVSFDSDTISGIHYYIQDYMGNNRMVVNRDGTVEQITHYYPYGGVIGDISTNESMQPYKFEGKELDRTFGLDNYDIHARSYFAMAPMWDRPDTKAEDYYGISPYVYCGGDPINLVDYNGRETRIYIETTGVGHTFITTGEGNGTTVYTYGRYGQLGKNKSVLRNLTPTGEGVLVILKGEGAHDYINKEIDKGAMIFSFSNVDEKSIDSHFSEIFQNSSDQPSNGKYKESNNAHVVDEYNVISNNCTTTALDALQSTGANTVQYWSNIPAMLKTNLSLLVEIQKIEEYFSKKKPTINIVEPDEIESEYEDY